MEYVGETLKAIVKMAENQEESQKTVTKEDVRDIGKAKIRKELKSIIESLSERKKLIINSFSHKL